MRLDVFFSPAQIQPVHLAGRVVAVIDVLRASSTIAAALSNGAKSVVPLDSADAVMQQARTFERKEVLLAGERKMMAIAGFDAGNSPAEFTPAVVEGRTVLLTTTNGTEALVSIQGAREIVVASFVNFSAVLALLRSALRGGNSIAILCAGREKQFSLEDAACAGLFVRHILKRNPGLELNDSAHASVLLDRKYGGHIEKLFSDSEHGRALAEGGFTDDLVVCGRIDAYPLVPMYQDRSITKLGPGRDR
ncbi:MAG: 2-phosphosulfolactate phosphatase [Gemmatimonadota bacterium]|nr:2-phosphosulfolactate phosphatase [Gemmatimonadota bacterium]